MAGAQPEAEFWLNLGNTVRLERFSAKGVDFVAGFQEERQRAR